MQYFSNSLERDETFIDINKKITIGFNKAMNDNTFNSDTLYLFKGATKIDCKITYSEADKEAYLTPVEKLDQFTEYTIFVSKKLQDFGGQAFTNDYQWSFKTSVVIARNGGKVGTSDGNLRLTIPPHSFDESISVQIKKISGSDIPVVNDNNLTIVSNNVYSLEPAGTDLKKKVTIKLKYNDSDIAGLDETKLTLYAFKDGKWQRIGGTINTYLNEIDGVINEFTKIGLFEDKNEYSGDIDKIIVDCQPRVFKPSEWGQTAISFELPKSIKYTVKVYNIAGKLMKVLAVELDSL